MRGQRPASAAALTLSSCGKDVGWKRWLGHTLAALIRWPHVLSQQFGSGDYVSTMKNPNRSIA